jgi:hypothetical protein
MKSIFTILLVLSTTAAFAARIPTMAEFDKYEALIKTSPSVSSMINDIKSGKISPIVQFKESNGIRGVVSRPGLSDFAGYTILSRFDARTPIGSEQENLELLRVILKAGVDVNIPENSRVDYLNNTLMDVASSVCSISAINLLIANGADQSLEDFYWVKAYRNWFDATTGSQFEKNCADVMNLLADKAKSVSMFSIQQLFFPGIDRNQSSLGAFGEGESLDGSMPSTVKASLTNLGITLSSKPDGDSPDEAWMKEEWLNVGVAAGQDRDSETITWWNNQSEQQKAWACYYSSFDEAIQGYHNLGISDDDLTTKSVGGSYTMSRFSNFMVRVFANYCNSLK